MNSIVKKTAAVAGALVLTFSLSACGDSGNKAGEQAPKPLTKDEVVSKLGDQELGGVKFKNVDIPAEQLKAQIEQSIQATKMMKVEPDECSVLINGTTEGVDPDDAVKNLVQFGATDPTSQVQAIGVNLKPADVVKKNIETSLKVKDKCADIKMGIGEQMKDLKLDVSDMPDLKDKAQLTYKLGLTMAGRPTTYQEQVLLKNGQFFNVQGLNPDDVHKVTVDVMKKLGAM